MSEATASPLPGRYVFSLSSGSESANSSELFHSELLVFVICLSVELSSVSPLQFDGSGCSPCLSDPVESLSEDTAFLEVLEVYFDFRLKDTGFYRESMKSTDLNIVKIKIGIIHY